MAKHPLGPYCRGVPAKLATLMTAGEIAQPTESGVVQSEQALVLAAADLNEASIPQLLQSFLQVGQRGFWVLIWITPALGQWHSVQRP